MQLTQQHFYIENLSKRHSMLGLFGRIYFVMFMGKSFSQNIFQMGLYLLYASKHVLKNVTSFRDVPRIFLRGESKS